MCTPCDLGDHWLTQAADGSLAVGMVPYAWPTSAEAYTAIERFEQQQQRTLAGEDETAR
jgi:hypothetical protein